MAVDEQRPFDRIYRPVNLTEYVGNAKLKQSIFKTLKTKKPQAYLLYGNSGCGKTSMARLLAKEYSCSNRDEEKGACGVCDSCRQIDEYIRTGDTGMLGYIKEINMSQDNGKRDVSWVLEDMQIPAYDNDWKIYIFDECHYATEALQNALLKAVEEPPENVLMIFCTTNPERLIPTLRNRMEDYTYKVQKPTEDELVGLLKHICEKEDASYNRKGLQFIANRADLTTRVAVKLLDRVLTEESSAEYDNVVKVIDALSDAEIIKFFQSLKKKNTLEYVTNLVKIKEKIDLNSFLVELKDFVKRGVYIINGIDVPGVTKNDILMYKSLFGDLGVVKVGLLLNKLLTFNERNLEIELLMWGYTGLEEFVVPEQEDSTIKELASELQLEQANASKKIKEQREVDRQIGVKNAEKMMESVSMDDLLKLSGTAVE